MTTRCGKWLLVVAMLMVLATPGRGEAQEFRPDIKADGVLIGGGSGAAAGVVISLLTDEDICSPGTCAYLGAVVGSLFGLVIDRDMAHPRPVAAGSWIDDGLVDGALSGIGLALLDASGRCGPRPARIPCTVPARSQRRLRVAFDLRF